MSDFCLLSLELFICLVLASIFSFSVLFWPPSIDQGVCCVSGTVYLFMSDFLVSELFVCLIMTFVYFSYQLSIDHLWQFFFASKSILLVIYF